MQNVQTERQEDQLAARAEHIEQEAAEAERAALATPARWPTRVRKATILRRYAA